MSGGEPWVWWRWTMHGVIIGEKPAYYLKLLKQVVSRDSIFKYLVERYGSNGTGSVLSEILPEVKKPMPLFHIRIFHVILH